MSCEYCSDIDTGNVGKYFDETLIRNRDGSSFLEVSLFVLGDDVGYDVPHISVGVGFNNFAEEHFARFPIRYCPMCGRQLSGSHD